MKKDGKQEYFFFSFKQFAFRVRGSISSGYPLKRTYCQLEDGQVVEYTERGDSATPKCRYNDIKALGNGYHHHCYPERFSREDILRMSAARKKKIIKRRRKQL